MAYQIARLTRVLVGVRAGDLRSNGIVGEYNLPPTVGYSFHFVSTGYDDPDCGRVIATSLVTSVAPGAGGIIFETKSGSTYILEIDNENPNPA